MAIELRQLRYFVAVAEIGNVSRAARRLYLTQPALSQALHQLERDVGVELLCRHPRGVDLTHAGLDFLADARAAVIAADRAVATAARHARRHDQQLAIGVLLECFPFLIEPLDRFVAARPDVRVEVRQLDFVSQVAELDEGRVDIALLCPPPPDAAMYPLRQEPMYVCLAAAHPLARRAEVTVDEIGDERFGRFPPGTPAYWRDQYTLTAARGGLPPRLTDRVFSAPLEGVAAVAAGEIVGASPAFLAERYAHGSIAAVPLAGAAAVTVGLAWRRATSAVRAFLETVCACAATGASAVGEARSA